MFRPGRGPATVGFVFPGPVPSPDVGPRKALRGPGAFPRTNRLEVLRCSVRLRAVRQAGWLRFGETGQARRSGRGWAWVRFVGHPGPVGGQGGGASAEDGQEGDACGRAGPGPEGRATIAW